MTSFIRWIPRYIALFGSLMAQPVGAAPQRIVCPAQLPATSIQIVNAPAGWTPFTPSFVRLHAAGALAGPPQSMAILKGETYQKGKNKSVDAFELSGFDKQKWMQCSYGLGNEVTLSTRLPDSTAFCSVSYTTTKPYGEVVIDILCR